VLSNGNHVTVTENVGYDSDGVKVYDNASGATNYYLRSSMLGGAIIEEINSSGQKNIGYVCLPGGVSYWRSKVTTVRIWVTWKHNTPAGTGEYTEVSSNANRIQD